MNTARALTSQPFLTVEWEMAKFSKWLSGFTRQLDDAKAGIALLKVAFDAVRMFMLKNPVDTGRSRAGWYVGAEACARAAGASYPVTFNNSQQEYGYSLGGYSQQLAGSEKYVEFINGVEYILPLEYGWSTQAPYGMVRITLQLIAHDLPDAIFFMLKTMWDTGKLPLYSQFRASKAGPVNMAPKPARPVPKSASKGSRGRGRR